MWLAPKVRSFSGLRVRVCTSDGALATASSTRARSKRTRGPSPSTSAPAWRRISRASGRRKFMPISSSTCMEASWIASIWSPETISKGG